MRKFEEKIVVSDGNLQYAVALKSEIKDGKDVYLRIRDGKIYFDSNWYCGTIPYEGSEETHEIAKQIFMSELQCAVKKRVSELKLLESVLMSLGIQDVLGTSLTESQKLLITQQIKQEVKNEIVEVVKPRAIKRKKTPES